MPYASINSTALQVDSGSGIALLVSAIIVTMLGLFLIGLYRSLPLYSKIRKFFEITVTSFYYFLWGLLGCGVLALIGSLARYFTTLSPEKVPLWFVGLCIGAYILISAFGYFIVKFKNRIKEYEKILVPEKTDDQEEVIPDDSE